MLSRLWSNVMANERAEYCDLVMKGGITSGVIYPNAVLRLSERYTFKNVGGTSAGAIAAAATAAAALGERRRTIEGVAAEGFAGLRAAAGELAQPGFIRSLFQPALGSRAAFRLLTTLASGPGVARTTMAVLTAILSAAPLEMLATLVVLAGLGWLFGGILGLAGAALPALLVSTVVAAAAATLRVAGALRRSSMGMCPGTTRRYQGGPSSLALSDWLHMKLQQLSGETERPLLFEDLWNAPRFLNEPGDRAITLELITTGVSHQEPRSLPFERSSFWFHAPELEELVPKSVVDWMVAEDQAPITSGGRIYHRLPLDGRLPVIVAARMSLSFPLLVSAVRLYEPDRGGRQTQAAAQSLRDDDRRLEAPKVTDALTTGGGTPRERPLALRPCWFSDGGISSNFPIHLFDAPLPKWPTFAIDLVYPQDEPGKTESEVFLPSENNQGWQRRFKAIERESGMGQLVAFLFSIVATMQNWRDVLQARAPGNRDRIIRVPLAAGEGGMNLEMDQATLDRLATKGSQAGQKLATEFNFNNHWWVRWRNVASAYERFTIGLAEAVSVKPTLSYEDARASALVGDPPPPSYKFTGDQQRDAQDRLKEMIQDGLHWQDTVPDLTQGAPRPLPELRIVPTY
jgi:predicted acylesterase/phospholipase RssA